MINLLANAEKKQPLLLTCNPHSLVIKGKLNSCIGLYLNINYMMTISNPAIETTLAGYGIADAYAKTGIGITPENTMRDFVVNIINEPSRLYTFGTNQRVIVWK